MATQLNGIDPELKLVDGLKLRVSNEELRQHLLERADYHDKRAREKEADLPRLREVMNDLERHGKQLATNVTHMNKSTYNLDTENPVESLEKDIRDHRNKVLVFHWFAQHLVPDMDYLLDETSLVRLEVLKR